MLVCDSAFAAAAVAADPTVAADAAASTDVSEVVVRADRARLLEQRPNSTVLGMDKPLIETPRSASFISAETLQRYGIQTIDKLIAISPSSYTASFYGVAGSLNIRGTLAENYFRGFKMIENLGTYGTPVAGAEAMEVVRGPPSPNYGAGKVGGMLNYSPKGGMINGAFPTELTGQVSATFGSYDKKNLNGQLSFPLNIGPIQGGVTAYAEADDSHSYYHGIYPKHQMFQLGSDFDLGHNWSLSAGGMGYHETGNVQTPGWNRVTQALIDNGTYETGRNTAIVDINGDGRIEPFESRAGCTKYPTGCSLHIAYKGAPLTLPVWFPLTTGLGTAHLDPRTIFISDADFSHTQVNVFYLDLVKDLGASGTLKLQNFYTTQKNQRFVSYGFPADFDASTEESRATYQFDLSGWNDFVVTKNMVGLSNRHYHGIDRQSFGSGQISLNRRDLTVGATPTDIFDSPFTTGDNGLQWELNIDSTWNDTGAFGMTDIMLGKRLDIILGGRYDRYHAHTIDTGVASFETNLPQSATDGVYTYSASASYKLGWGLMPYVTFDKATSLEVGQAGDLKSSQLQGVGNFLSQGQLQEAGIKFQLLDKTLVGALDVYKQRREQLAGENSVSQPTVSKGFEYELRYLATDSLSFTLAGDVQKTTVIGPDHSTVYITPATAGISNPVLAYGSEISVDSSTLPGRGGNYTYSIVPKSVTSLFATYISKEQDWGRWGATVGATHADKTMTLVQNPLVLPAYTIVNVSGFYGYGPWEVSLNVDNAFDERYFTPSQSTYVNIAVLPGRGREWRATVQRKF